MRLPEGLSKNGEVIPAGRLERERRKLRAKQKLQGFDNNTKAVLDISTNLFSPRVSALLAKALADTRIEVAKQLLAEAKQTKSAPNVIYLADWAAKKNPEVFINPLAVPTETIQRAHTFATTQGNHTLNFRKKSRYTEAYGNACEEGKEFALQKFLGEEDSWNEDPSVYLALYDYLVRQNILPPLPSQALPQIP